MSWQSLAAGNGRGNVWAGQQGRKKAKKAMSSSSSSKALGSGLQAVVVYSSVSTHNGGGWEMQQGLGKSGPSRIWQLNGVNLGNPTTRSSPSPVCTVHSGRQAEHIPMPMLGCTNNQRHMAGRWHGKSTRPVAERLQNPSGLNWVCLSKKHKIPTIE